MQKKFRDSAALIVVMTFFAGAVQAETFSADVWADNWFSLDVNGAQVAEDSVSINTERSFNAESFTFTAERPFVIGLTAKDFKENDTGLEYIGTGRQQMGDGGVIMQIKDASGEIVAVTDGGWKCLVTHHAPIQKSCASEPDPIAGEGACGFETTEEPEGWSTAAFDASAWTPATVHSERAVRPKDGYDEISWDRSAQLIWGPDLETDNTMLCRLVVE
ncbi:MAG: PEBP family protein [Stappiaceae bacterium]